MYNVIAFGEVLWDVFGEQKKLGGAPANFTYHISRLGTFAQLISGVGKDELGDEIIYQLTSKLINTRNIQVGEYDTSLVEVSLNENKEATYTIHENCAWDHIALTDTQLDLVKDADLFYFGTLSQRSQETQDTLYELLKHKKEGCKVVVDLNLRQAYYSKELIERTLEQGDLIKVNEDEIVVLQQLFDLDSDIHTGCKELINRYNIEAIVMTLGEAGSKVITREQIINQKAKTIQVVDTVGAGDSFFATVCYGYLKGEPWDIVLEHATEVSAYVCTQKGGMPDMKGLETTR